MNFNDNKTSVMKLVDLLKTHELLMEKCPEVIEIIENLYLDIEKMQIQDAYDKGSSEWNKVEYKDGKDFYKKSYEV
jgi:hypothetical protein